MLRRPRRRRARFCRILRAGHRRAGARRPRDDRQTCRRNTARPCGLLSRSDGRDDPLSSPSPPRDPARGQAGRGLRQGAGVVARRQHARPSLYRSDGARSPARSSRRSPDRAGHRTACPLAAAGKAFDEELPRPRRGQRARRTQKVEGSNYELHDGDNRDRRDHQLHQYLEPERHARRRACSPRRRSSAASRPSRG